MKPSGKKRKTQILHKRKLEKSVQKKVTRKAQCGSEIRDET